MGDYENLVEMGFDPRRVALALKNTSGFNDAITWLAENEEKSIEELEGTQAGSGAGGAEGETISNTADGEGGESALLEDTDNSQDIATALSLRCTDCGKLFASPARAQFHADRTGHDNFEESTEQIKPLTEEEKKAKLEELKKKLAEKRAAKAVEDVKANKANELIRRKKDAESERIKEELRKKEHLKEAEKRKQEKKEDALARQKIKEKIKADQEARRLKSELEKAGREGRALEQAQSATTSTTASSAARPTASYTETRLQLRLPPPYPPLLKKFSVDNTLSEVAQAVREESGFEVSSFTTTYPRNVYDATHFGMTLKEAKLVPSAALIVNG